MCVETARARRVTSEIVVALLRASLGTGPLPDATRLAECDWTRFALLARHHGIGPILFRALQERAASVPAEWLQIFKAEYVTNAFHNQLAQASVDEIGAVFSSERIPVILMKGAALLRTLYDDQGLRTLCDVDLLVDERDVERADTQLQARGLKLPVSDHPRSLAHGVTTALSTAGSNRARSPSSCTGGFSNGIGRTSLIWMRCVRRRGRFPACRRTSS